MNKQDMVKNLIKVANHLDTERDFESANELTRIAKIVVSLDDYDPSDMGGFNPDDFSGADDTEAMEMELDQLLMDLDRAAKAGELDEEDISVLQNMLRSSKGLKTNEMSFDDDFELGLGAVPHTKLDNLDEDEYYDDDEDSDIDLSPYSDDDEDPSDPNAWMYEDDDDDRHPYDDLDPDLLED